MSSSYPQNDGKRFLAVAGAAALGVAAFASPAAAQTPEPVVADVVVDEPIAIGGDFASGAIHLEFGDDFTPGEVDVTAQLSVYGDGIELAGGHSQHGDCEVGGTPPQWVNCLASDANKIVDFKFDYRALDTAEPGEYEYALLIGVDGENLDPIEGTIEVGYDDGGEEYPFLHADASYTGIAPGTSVEVSPVYLQDQPLAANAEAVLMFFGRPDYLNTGDDVQALADYDNCVAEEYGLACVFTEFTDQPGQAFTLSDPVTYAIGAKAPGPIEICRCAYTVSTLDFDALETRFGGVFWDEGSDNLLGLEATDAGGEFGEPTHGSLSITTTANPYDLAVAEVKAEGAKGTTTTVDVTVTNEGPASAYNFFDGPGSYVILGNLPTGLKLVEADERWACLDKADWEQYFGDDYDGDLAEIEFACLFSALAVEETRELQVEVEITGTADKADGTIEVVSLEHEGYPGVADADIENNTAVFSVDTGGSGSPQLPKTGASLGLVIGIAALVLVAGVVMMVLTARKRKAVTEE